MAASLVLATLTVAAIANENSRASSAPAPPRLLSPTLGRPAFAAPGGEFRLAVRLPASTKYADLSLARGVEPRLRYALAVADGVVGELVRGRPVTIAVPRYVAAGTYDLEVRHDAGLLVERHCVAVGRVGTDIRIVHLSNMNIGDLSAPRFDQRLIDEINIVAPTLIVASGDYLDATHPNPDTGWRRLVEFLAGFDAPVAAACGDHDDLAAYSRHVAPSPIGTILVGPHRCMVLCDHGLAPIGRNAEQIRWVEAAVSRPGPDGITMIVSHDSRPNLLALWREGGVLSRASREKRIGLWLSGGRRDWDGREYREIIDAAAPLTFFRTHQSSTATLGGASGISHYRIVDIRGDRVTSPSGEPPTTTGRRQHSRWGGPPCPPTRSDGGHGGPPHQGANYSDAHATAPSTPVGRLAVTFDGANDGSQTELSFTATNALPYRLDNLATTVRLRKAAGYKPWCHGGRLERAIDLGEVWECRVRFDLPDKGIIRARVGSAAPPVAPEVRAAFSEQDELRFARRETAEGVAFLSLISRPPTVRVENRGPGSAVLSPLLRLDGTPIAYRPLGEQAAFATAYRVGVRAGETVELQLDLSAVRVQPGRRELQAYIDVDGVVTPWCRAVEIVIDD